MFRENSPGEEVHNWEAPEPDEKSERIKRLERQIIMNPEKGRMFLKGDRVTVPRSNGSIEKDWQFVSVSGDGRVLVARDNLSKALDLETFSRYQKTLEIDENLRVGVGDTVTAVRSSGALESDWILKDVRDGKVIIGKPDSERKGLALRKDVPVKMFIEWQKQNSQSLS